MADWAELWRSIILGPDKSWVAFSNGTCVILMEPEPDLAAQATRLLAEWGPVHIATPSADFSVVELEDGKGAVVTCHHPDILSYVPPENGGSEIAVGMLGRQLRDEDAKQLTIAHVEDRRTP